MASKVIVIGMHRSGTSALTGCLNLMGYNVGTQPMGKNPNENPKGFFEDYNMFRLNEDMLEYMHGKWHIPPNTILGDLPHQLRDFDERAKATLANAFPEEPWAWKDPRTCLLIPYWLQFIKNPVFIVNSRSPADIARSLQKRNSFSFDKGIRLWSVYMYCALRAIQHYPVYYVYYNTLFSNDHSALHDLAEWLNEPGITVPDDKISEFLDIKLRHNLCDLDPEWTSRPKDYVHTLHRRLFYARRNARITLPDKDHILRAINSLRGEHEQELHR